jgi:hypothetical protein
MAIWSEASHDYLIVYKKYKSSTLSSMHYIGKEIKKL